MWYIIFHIIRPSKSRESSSKPNILTNNLKLPGDRVMSQSLNTSLQNRAPLPSLFFSLSSLPQLWPIHPLTSKTQPQSQHSHPTLLSSPPWTCSHPSSSSYFPSPSQLRSLAVQSVESKYFGSVNKPEMSISSEKDVKSNAFKLFVITWFPSQISGRVKLSIYPTRLNHVSRMILSNVILVLVFMSNNLVMRFLSSLDTPREPKLSPIDLPI